MRKKADKEREGGQKRIFWADVLYGRLHTTRADYNYVRANGPIGGSFAISLSNCPARHFVLRWPARKLRATARLACAMAGQIGAGGESARQENNFRISAIKYSSANDPPV